MIDDKKIEETAKQYAKEAYISKFWQGCYEEGFKSCAKWMQEEFLKDLWHPYDEVPTRKNSNILLFFEDYSADSEEDYDAYYDLAATREGFTQDEWELFMHIGGTPSNWLYIDDLFPKEGGDQ